MNGVKREFWDPYENLDNCVPFRRRLRYIKMRNTILGNDFVFTSQTEGGRRHQDADIIRNAKQSTSSVLSEE